MLRRPLPHRPNAKMQTADSPVPDRKSKCLIEEKLSGTCSVYCCPVKFF